MGKALMVSGNWSATVASGNEYNLFGYASTSATEANTLAQCTETATFKNLRARITNGNSGTATFRFRNNGANGNSTFNITGTGVNEDAVNSDTVTAGNTFNIAYTDTGSDSTILWTKACIEFASGHGNIHGAAAFTPVVFDVGDATRFIGLGGDLAADGGTNEDLCEYKIYAYDTFEALQVRVTANARVNNSVFKNRINGADGTGVITFGSATTGLLTDTAIGDVITSGQTVNASITLVTGIQDLTVSLVAATLKSSNGRSETFTGGGNTGINIGGGTTNYQPIGGRLHNTTISDANGRIKIGFPGVASNFRAYCAANTSTIDTFIKLMKNGSAVVTITITAGGAAGVYENTTDIVSFIDTDEFSWETSGGDVTLSCRSIGMTFSSILPELNMAPMMPPMSKAA